MSSIAAFPAADELLLLGALALAALAGFGAGLWLGGGRARGAEWRVRRAEAMAAMLRKTCDEYRRRLGVRSPQQAEKKLSDQERKLAMLRFQVASLGSELKSMRTREPEPQVIDLTGSATRR